MPAVFNLELAGLAFSVFQDEPTVSDAYAEALGVAKRVLGAELARIVPRLASTAVAVEEPESPALGKIGFSWSGSGSYWSCTPPSTGGPSPGRASVPSSGPCRPCGWDPWQSWVRLVTLPALPPL